LRLLFGHGEALGHLDFHLLSLGEVLFGDLQAVNFDPWPGKKSGQDNDANQIPITHTNDNIGKAGKNLRHIGISQLKPKNIKSDDD
jgi:hypothetical protein